jgi:repressor LexA
MPTERQEAILEFLRDFQSREGIPPSTRQIQRYFGFKSQTTAMRHLRTLAQEGCIKQLAGRSWGLKTQEVQAQLYALPVYGTIPAGLPAMQEQEPEQRIAVDPTIFGVIRPRPNQIWALRVSGDSMTDAHILDGDLAVLERRSPRPGDIIAALLDETTTTLKLLVYVRGKPALRAANKSYRDIIPEGRLESQGVLVGVIRICRG